MKKRLLTGLLVVMMMFSAMATPAFGAEPEVADNIGRLASLNDPETGFTMQKVVITPVVKAADSSTKFALSKFSTTTTLTKSFFQMADWSSYIISGFEQYIFDYGYEMVGWNVSLTGKYTVSNENSVIPADKLKYFEYFIDDGTPKKVDIQYSKNMVATYSWFAPQTASTTMSRFNWVVTYADGSSGRTRDKTGRLSVSLSYWPQEHVVK